MSERKIFGLSPEEHRKASRSMAKSCLGCIGVIVVLFLSFSVLIALFGNDSESESKNPYVYHNDATVQKNWDEIAVGALGRNGIELDMNDRKSNNEQDVLNAIHNLDLTLEEKANLTIRYADFMAVEFTQNDPAKISLYANIVLIDYDADDILNKYEDQRYLLEGIYYSNVVVASITYEFDDYDSEMRDLSMYMVNVRSILEKTYEQDVEYLAEKLEFKIGLMDKNINKIKVPVIEED